MTHPVIDLGGLELPQAPDIVGGHVLLGDPGVDGVFGDPKMGGDAVGRKLRLGHVGPPSQPVWAVTPMLSEYYRAE